MGEWRRAGRGDGGAQFGRARQGNEDAKQPVSGWAEYQQTSGIYAASLRRLAGRHGHSNRRHGCRLAVCHITFYDTDAVSNAP